MKGNVYERCVKEGQILLEKRITVREIARELGVSKSTVHKDLTERLPEVDLILAKKVKEILEVNKAERHLRGGAATRRKYKGISICTYIRPQSSLD